METDRIICGDCLEVLRDFEDNSVDLVLTDPPYGTTACKWDSIISLEPMWKHLKRLIKPNGAIVMTAREPFTSILVCSNLKEYKHKWVWNKKQSGSFQNAKYMPLQIEEDVVVFCASRVNYYPIMRKGKMRKRGGAKETSRVVGGGLRRGFENCSDRYYPVNIVEMANPRINKLHPTQKPVALKEYLIKTYTNEGELVLDFAIGSVTTTVPCVNTGRHYIGIEKDIAYWETACKRVKELEKGQGVLF